MEEKKPWWKSITVWSAIISTAGLIVPKYSTIINETTGIAVAILSQLGVVVGRFKARSQVTLK